MKREMRKLKGIANEEMSVPPVIRLRWVCSALSQGRVLAIAFGVLLLCAPSNSGAVPAKKSCDEPDVYSRIKCKQEGLVVQMEHMVDENLTKGATGQKVSERQKNLLRKGKAKVRLLHKHVRTDDFKSAVKGMAKRNKAEGCDWVPLSDDNDNGICDWPEEECEAKNFPDEICDPRATKDHPKSERYICKEICTAESSWAEVSSMAAEEREKAELDEVAQDLEDTYDALEDNLIETNETLEAFNEILGGELVAARLSNDPCDNIDPLPEGLDVKRHVLRVAGALAHVMYEQAASGFCQTVVGVAFGFGGGGNACSLGLIVATAAGIVEQAYIAVDAIVSEKQGELQDNTFLCLQEAVSNIKAVDGKVDASAAKTQEEIKSAKEELSGQMEVFKQEMKDKLEQAIVLLNTPQGQRPGFPKE